MNHDIDLLRAFPPTPDNCRAALSAAARSVKEEPVRRKAPVAIVLAALLTLMTTVAIAEGWNVLQFLGIQPDSDATQLVQPVSVSGKAGNVTLSVNSVIADGEHLAFDWTITNAKPDTPVFVSLESARANGSGSLYNISSTGFHHRWLPAYNSAATLQGGFISPLADWLSEEDVIHVELILGLHTAIAPVYMTDAIHDFRHNEEIIRRLDAGDVVIIGDGSVLHIPSDYDPETNRLTIPGTERTELRLAFDVDMKAARASLKHPDLPAPAANENVTLTLEHFTLSPLQIRLTAVAAWADDAPVGLTGKFLLRDKAGNAIKVKNVSASPESYTEMLWHSNRFEDKETIWECAIIAPTAALPDEADLVFLLTDGTELVLPLKFR